jgi:NADH dehydrogenase
MTKKRICLLGGSGFVGRRVAAQFVAAGHDVTVLTRHRDRHRDLLVLPTATVVEGDVHNAVFLRRQFDHHDAVVNLVGILNERGFSGRGFVRVHAELPEKVVEACRVARVPRLLHMSALHARLNGPSHYLRTKAMGEDTVHRAHNADFAVTSFRPSVLFGPGDSFLNRFAELLRVVPGVLPLACPKARFQPVFVDDVAQALVRALDNHQTFNQHYDLCGPRVYTLRQIVEYTASLIGKSVKVLGLGQFASYAQALVMELVPGKPFSLDNYHSLQVDSVCQRGFPEIFGITPTALESVAPLYLSPVAGDEYAPLRASARR